MRVKYIGPNSVVVGGTHMIQGEVRDLSEKQANRLLANPFFVVLDRGAEVEQAEVAPVQEIEQPVVEEASTAPELPAVPKPVRKPRSKKK
jgi:hypothetical protein